MTTEQPLIPSYKQGRIVLLSGKLVSQSVPLPGATGGAGATWHIVVISTQAHGKHMLHVAWKRHGGSLPHYCADGEKGWDCVDTDYYPDWE